MACPSSTRKAVQVLRDAELGDEAPLLALFRNRFALERLEKAHPDLTLDEIVAL